MPPEFAIIEQGSEAGHYVIAARGEIDLFTAPELKQVITEVIESGERRVAIDLSEVSFLDSTALGVLIGAVKRLRSRGGALAVVNTDSSIAKTFKITGRDQIFTIVSSRAEALEALDDAIEGDAA
jgi:anti-sigma B factor antagonist